MIQYYEGNNSNIKSFNGGQHVEILFSQIKSYLDSIV